MTKASDIANAFNHYFVNVGKSLSQAIPRVDASFSSFLFNPLPHSFFLSPTSVQEIQDIILSLKSGKASGPFSIPVSLLKILSSIIAKPSEILYNLSFSSGTVPDSFKMARVIPVYKSGSSSSLSNYRPISLLSIFNQILEKLMYNRLYKYLEKYNIIYSGQFGFRANHSTDQLLYC